MAKRGHTLHYIARDDIHLSLRHVPVGARIRMTVRRARRRHKSRGRRWHWVIESQDGAEVRIDQVEDTGQNLE